MLSLRKALLVLGIVALSAAPGMAQGQRGFGGFGQMMGGGGMLLMNPGVQKELKLTEEQITKIGEATTEVRQKFQEERQALRDVPQEERGPKMAEIMRKQNEETKKALVPILKPEQTARLRQIELQTTGVMIVLNDTEAASKLKITDDQKQSLKEIQDDLGREMRTAFQPGGDPQEGVKRMQALGKEGRTKAAALLNDEQKKTWKEMTGEPFEVKFEGFGGFGQGKGKRKKDK